ncbi:hypothetical protein N8498_03925 [Candidatus Pseudothioglobus singularis]|nr:hypothetical protein [Candidatus Pseudothioglobus singularis]
MIVPIVGNVTYSITLDPSVWIFDKRKILLDDAFKKNSSEQEESTEEAETKKAAERWNRALHPKHSKPPVNPDISRAEGEEILKNTYVMPIREFIESAEPAKEATEAALEVKGGDDVIISLSDLKQGFLLFAVEGKPLKEDGPVHFYFNDDAKRDIPIKGVSKIKIL